MRICAENQLLKCSFSHGISEVQIASPEGTPPADAEQPSLAQLLQEKPLQPSSILIHEPSIKDSAQYVSIVLNQLSLLLATASDASWQSHHRQIRYILSTERTHHLDQFAAAPELSPLDRIFEAELESLARDCTFLEFFLSELAAFFGPRATTDVFRVLDRYAVDPVLAFTFVSRLADPDSPQVKLFFEESAHKVPALVIERTTTTDPPDHRPVQRV
ncbi:hypothetical protein OXX79_006648 [Metschnikowia pulcherrima]